MKKMKAPWPDYAGNAIYEGDTIRYPGNGETAVVRLDQKYAGPGQWRAVFQDGMSLFLGNQVSKGMAVVVKPLARSAGIDTLAAAAEKNAAALRRMDAVAAQSAVAAASVPEPEIREVLRDALASGLSGYMRECDLYPASDCGDLLDELCDLAIATLRPFVAPLHEAGNAAAVQDPFSDDAAWHFWDAKKEDFLMMGDREIVRTCFRHFAASQLPATAPSIAAPTEVERDAVIEALHELALLMSDTIRGEYQPDSFTLQPAVHALAAFGIEFPDDDYLLTQRESCVVVPTKPTASMLKAMAESRAVDDEGEFPAMLDLLDFSGENKTRTVLEAAYAAAILAAAKPK